MALKPFHRPVPTGRQKRQEEGELGQHHTSSKEGVSGTQVLRKPPVGGAGQRGSHTRREGTSRAGRDGLQSAPISQVRKLRSENMGAPRGPFRAGE